MQRPPPYPRLDAAAQSQVLRRILDRCRPTSVAKAPPVVVFDLDGTLMDNRPRTCAILRDIGAGWRARAPEAAERLLSARPEQLDYLLTDTLARLGVHQSALVAEAETLWRARFFSDDDIRHDVPLAGATSFARACFEAGATLVYFTGRDLPLMGAGTFRSLRDLGFPVAVAGTELVLKPDASMPDEAFKRMFAPTLRRVGEVVAVFDNEPANCNVLHREFEGADTVFIDTQHLPGAPPLDPHVHVLADFTMA